MKPHSPFTVPPSPLTADELEQCKATIERMRKSGQITQKAGVPEDQVETELNRLKNKRRANPSPGD